jgi:uncharacterized iron-regulated membrane protein
VATGLILIYLIATGLPLQFTEPLNLDGRFVQSTIVLDWYGVHSPQEAYRSNDAVHIGNLLYWNSQPVAELNSFMGALRQADLAIVATESGLFVFPAETQRMPGSGSVKPETIILGERIRRVGLAGDGLVLDTDSGLMMMDAALLNASPADQPSDMVAWAPLTPLAGETLATYQQLARGRILSFERFLQDLHSGRAFGTVGEWVINLATLAMAVLAFTGLLIWWRIR